MAKLSLPSIPSPLTALLARHPRWLGALFFLPLILGLLAKLWRSPYWFGDYQAVACAGLKVLENAPIYTLNLHCEGMRASSYVYIPIVAQAAAFFERLMTEPGLFCFYLAAYLSAAAALVYVPFLARATPGDWRGKVPFAVFLSGSAFMWGNIAVILHWLVLLGALAMEVTPWLFVAGVVAAAWVKPTFLTYLAVILIADLPLMRRLGLTAAGVILGLLPTVMFALTGGDLADQWYALLSHFVYDVTPGAGFFGWSELIGFDSNGRLVKSGYLIYAALLTLSGLALAKGLKLNARERLWLGLSLAVLLIPRIMSQDLFLLGPGLMVVAQKSAQLRGRAGHLLQHGEGILLALCTVALAGALTELGDYSEPVALLGLSLYLLWAGYVVTGARAGRILAPFLVLLRGKSVSKLPAE